MDILSEDPPCKPLEQKNAFVPVQAPQNDIPLIEIEADGITFRFSGPVDASLYEKALLMIGGRLSSATNNKFNKALTYARNRKETLMTYLEDGHCSLSNNMSENSIRPVVVGRKNWLFSDTMDGAERRVITRKGIGRAGGKAPFYSSVKSFSSSSCNC